MNLAALWGALWGARGRWTAAAAGALLPLSFAPFDAWYLAVPLFAILFRLWEGQTSREMAWRGFWFGFAAFSTGTYWLYISVHGFAGAPVIVAVILMVSLFWAMACFIAAGAYFAGRIGSPAGLGSGSLSPVLRWCILWPACFVVFEWVRGWILTGFPWLAIGYGQIDGPLKGWAPLMGIHAVSFATLVTAGSLLSFVRGGNKDRLVAGGIVVALFGSSTIIYDREWTQPMDRELRVSLVQGSIPQDRKWLPEQLRPTMDLYRELTFGLENVDLVIWPEVAIPSLARNVNGYLENLANGASARGMQIYLGVLTRDEATGQYRNSLIGVGADAARYHKRHLVPFGEFFPVPDIIRGWMRAQGLPNQDTLAGGWDQPPLPLGELRLSPSICYEDAYGAEQLDFLPEAQLLINVSNDAWFGDSIAPHQHLQIARMRALEAGRFMLRATNTGITAVISPHGDVADRSPQFETHVLSASVRPHSGATPYVRVGNYGILFVFAVIIAVGGYLNRRQSVYPSAK